MNRRIDYRRRRKIRKIRAFIGVVCMAGLLAAVLLNQTRIMQWMNQLSAPGQVTNPDTGNSIGKENLSLEESVIQVPEDVNHIMISTEHMNADETGPMASPGLRKMKPDTNAIYQEAQERRKRNQKFTDMEIHGAYFSAGNVSNRSKVEKIIERLEETDINAVVVNIKDDTGLITFRMDNELAIEADAVSSQIWDAKEMVDLFHDHGIYVIGRIVAFRDATMVLKKKEYAVLNPDGSVFHDRAGDTWLNPYNKDCWNYVVSVAEDAADLGFDEIQFDYIRFSTEAKEGKVSFGKHQNGQTKTEAITNFVQYAVKKLHAKNAKVSADVFGAIINSEIDARTVGQDYVELSRYLDYICPMIYPSHYADGCYGLEVPDLQPYELILAALNDSVKKLVVIDEESSCAKVRPWLQDFTANWRKKFQRYGSEQVEEQIKGVYDSGYTQWLLWNSLGSYSTLDE